MKSHKNNGSLNQSPFKEVEEIYTRQYHPSQIFFKEAGNSLTPKKGQGLSSCYVNKIYQCDSCCLSNRMCGTQQQCDEFK